MSAEFKEQLAAALYGGDSTSSVPQDTSTFATVARLIATTAQIDEKYVSCDARLAEDLNIDSLTLLELAVRLEDRFDVELSREDVVDAGTVGALAELVDTDE